MQLPRHQAPTWPSPILIIMFRNIRKVEITSISDLLIAREERRGQKRARLCSQSELTSVT